MGARFDHLVLLVTDIDAATRDFGALGFSVRDRADTSHGSTSFRFVAFADGSYILLTAFTSEAGRQGHRLGPVLDAGEGWADYSFTVPDAAAAGAALGARGFPTRGPVAVANVLAGGERWRLELLMAGRGAGGDVALPFLVTDVEGRSHRIPGPAVHANGATGIAGVRLTTADPARVAAALALVGGVATEAPGGGIRLRFGPGHVDVLGLEAPGGRPGGGLAGATLLAREARVLDPALTHGAPLALVRG